MRPPQPLPVPSTADYSDEDAYEDFCPPSPETISSPAYPLRHSMYTTQDANTSQLSAMTSPGPPAVPPRMSSDRATPPPFLHEGTYINQNRRSSGTPDSYSTTPLLSPVHCAPDPNTSPKITSSESLHSLSIEGPNTLPRTSSIRPQSTVEPTSPTELPNPILNRNSAYSHKESQPLFPRTITPPAHFPRTDPTSPSKPPIAPKPATKLVRFCNYVKVTLISLYSNMSAVVYNIQQSLSVSYPCLCFRSLSKVQNLLRISSYSYRQSFIIPTNFTLLLSNTVFM